MLLLLFYEIQSINLFYGFLVATKYAVRKKKFHLENSFPEFESLISSFLDISDKWFKKSIDIWWIVICDSPQKRNFPHNFLIHLFEFKFVIDFVLSEFLCTILNFNSSWMLSLKSCCLFSKITFLQADSKQIHKIQNLIFDNGQNVHNSSAAKKANSQSIWILKVCIFSPAHSRPSWTSTKRINWKMNKNLQFLILQIMVLI